MFKHRIYILAFGILAFLLVSLLPLKPVRGSELAKNHCIDHLTLDKKSIPKFENLFPDFLIAKAIKGRLGPFLQRGLVPDLLSQALNRRAINSAATLLDKLKRNQPLTPEEGALFREVFYREWRIAEHARRQQTAPRIDSFTGPYAWTALRDPKTLRDQIWVELGLRPSPETNHFERINWIDIQKNLLLIQQRLGVPESSRLRLVFVHSIPNSNAITFQPVEESLSPGTDFSNNHRWLRSEDFLHAIFQGYMPVEAGLHDLAHLLLWTRRPEIFEAFKKLGQSYLATPDDQALYFRLEWASEVLALPRFGNGENIRGQLLSKNAWRHREARSVSEIFSEILHEVSEFSDTDLEKYAREKLIPQYFDWFEPLSGGFEHHGEALSTYPNATRQLLRFYHDHSELGGTNRLDSKTYKYGPTDLGQEQVYLMHLELQEALNHPLETAPAQGALIRDIIARMELVLGELSEQDPVAVLQLFRSDSDTRLKSRLAEVLRIVRGSHSTLYRALVD